MLKNLSLELLFDNIKTTFLRFPLTLISAIIATLAGMILLEPGFKDSEQIVYIKIGMCGVLGIASFLSLKLHAERHEWKADRLYIAQIILGALLIAYFFYLPAKNLNYVEALRYTLWLGAVHFLVAFSPYLFKQHETNGFWQFNQEIFIRLIIGALYSSVLYAGISIALVSIDFLFGANIEPQTYGRLWLVVAGVFNTWFFLAGVPKDFELLEQTYDYPKPLKLFTQYVLLPLVVLYLTILYVYTFKILFSWELPKGLVSNLILAFSTAGIFSLLLVYPLRESENNKWINIFTKWFYIAILPLLILLFVSIGKRIFEYGITELRYFVIILAFWLLAMALYFLLSKKKLIQVIPMSLFVVFIFSSLGPWGAFYVSTQSQIARFTSILSQYNRFKEGKIIPFETKQKIKEKDVENISSIMSFLSERDRINYLQPYFTVNLDSLQGKDEESSYVKKNKVLAFLGEGQLLESHEVVAANFERFDFYAKEQAPNAIDVKGYDYFHTLNFYEGTQIDSIQLNASEKLMFKVDLKGNTIEIQHLKAKQKPITIATLKLDALQDNLLRNHQDANNTAVYVDRAALTIIKENTDCKVKIVFNSISVAKRSAKDVYATSLSGNFLIKFLEKK